MGTGGRADPLVRNIFVRVLCCRRLLGDLQTRWGVSKTKMRVTDILRCLCQTFSGASVRHSQVPLSDILRCLCQTFSGASLILRCLSMMENEDEIPYQDPRRYW